MAAEDDADFLDMLCDLMEDDESPAESAPGPATKSPSKPSSSSTVPSKPSSRNLSTAPSIQQTAKRKAPAKPEVVKSVDPYCKFRVSSRRISIHDMEQRMHGKINLPLEHVEPKRLESCERDVVTFGVLTNKGATQQAKNGKNYATWTLSNLEAASVKLILMGEVHSCHWKTNEGSVIGLLNPRALSNSDSAHAKHDSVAVSLEEAGQLMVLGKCADYGTCKGIRRDGAPCTIAVNTSLGAYCQYHVGTALRQKKKQVLAANATRSQPSRKPQEHKLLSNPRMALQGSYAPAPGLPGQYKPTALERRRREKPVSEAALSQMRSEVTEDTVAGLSNRNPFKRAMLQASQDPANEPAPRRGNSSASLLLKPPHKGPQTALSAKLLALTGPKPRLGRGLGQSRGRELELNKAASLAAARMKAAANQPNFVTSKRPAGAANITPSNPEGAKRNKPVYNLKGEIISESNLADLKALKSSHSAVREAQDSDKVMSSMQHGVELDQLFDKLRTIKRREHTVFKCQQLCYQCNNLTRKKPQLCQNKGHTVTKAKAFERFFVCLNCHNHVAVVGEKVPTSSCRCGKSQWKPASMMKEYKDAAEAKVKARGEEHGRVLNSWMNKAAQ